ncbi:MAG: uracil-xanthine permease family protein [Negativicutes bacterium]
MKGDTSVPDSSHPPIKRSITHKPATLIYGVDDPVPVSSLIPLILQQVIMLSVDLIFPVLVVAAAGGSMELAQNLVSMMMISMGGGTILQALRSKSVGSGYFCAHETGSPYFPVSVMAVQTGGIPLLCGMTVLTGCFQALLSRIIHRMRILFPVEITGLIVTLMAITFITYAIPNFAGIDAAGRSNPLAFALSAATLGVIICMHVWGTQRLREYSIIAGIFFGYMGSYFLDLIPTDQVNKFLTTAWISTPSFSHIGFAFDATMILPFLIAAFCSSIKTIGNLTTCQKVNDENWKRLDVKSVGNGLFAESIGTISGGLLGTMGQTTSSGSVGLAVATGATSRHIAFGVGACFILLAFFPKIAALFAIMPQPVIGVILLVEIAFVVPTAMQICSSRMLDARRMFVLGISMAFGFGVSIVPAFGESFPLWLQPLTRNALAVGTILAISLHLLFRIGIASHQTLTLYPWPDLSDKIDLFLKQCGGAWGARPEVVSRATSAVLEFMESLATLELSRESVTLDANFEEFNLNIDIYYEGDLMEFPQIRPTEEELLIDDQAFIRLSGYLLTRYADRITSERKDGRCHVRFNFEH